MRGDVQKGITGLCSKYVLVLTRTLLLMWISLVWKPKLMSKLFSRRSTIILTYYILRIILT